MVDSLRSMIKIKLFRLIRSYEWIEKSECRLLLTKNCRNTYEIALTAYNVIDVELNQKIQMMNGEKTRLTFVQVIQWEN